MSVAEAKKCYSVLVEEIRRHDHSYYVLAAPTVSDADYDRLYRELLDLEASYPELVSVDSPSQRVGGKPVSEFPAHLHAVPMMSLDNTYSFGELGDFCSGWRSCFLKLNWTGRLSQRLTVWQ